LFNILRKLTKATPPSLYSPANIAGTRRIPFPNPDYVIRGEFSVLRFFLPAGRIFNRFPRRERAPRPFGSSKGASKTRRGKFRNAEVARISRTRLRGTSETSCENFPRGKCNAVVTKGARLMARAFLVLLSAASARAAASASREKARSRGATRRPPRENRKSRLDKGGRWRIIDALRARRRASDDLSRSIEHRRERPF